MNLRHKHNIWIYATVCIGLTLALGLATRTVWADPAPSTLNVRAMGLGISLYIATIAAIVWWTRKRVAQPIQRLTHAVRQSIELDQVFNPSEKGSKEIRQLARYIAELAKALEKKAELRTVGILPN